MKKSVLFLTAAIIIFFLIPATVYINTSISRKDYDSSYTLIKVEELEPGDIIFRRSTWMSGFIPGYWSHTAIFDGYENGIPYVVESSSEDDGIVRRISLQDYVDGKLHVMAGKVKANNTIKMNALKFAREKIGEAYFNYNYLSKGVGGTHYYCSEFVWASYFSQGVDLDSNPDFNFRYAWGVAPQEIFDSELVVQFNLET